MILRKAVEDAPSGALSSADGLTLSQLKEVGAEVGIATDKLRARGPMGLEELTTYKWVVEGTGELRR